MSLRLNDFCVCVALVEGTQMTQITKEHCNTSRRREEWTAMNDARNRAVYKMGMWLSCIHVSTTLLKIQMDHGRQRFLRVVRGHESGKGPFRTPDKHTSRSPFVGALFVRSVHPVYFLYHVRCWFRFHYGCNGYTYSWHTITMANMTLFTLAAVTTTTTTTVVAICLLSLVHSY